MEAVQTVAGFSLTNRMLLYTSLALTPAQFISGIGSNCPSNIGFLAYNWYTQLSWYSSIKDGELHALSLLPIHFNFIYAITYIGGVSSGNIFMAIVLGLGTAGVMILNTVAAWTSWATNQPEGYGVYQFFFFGWRTLDEGWHKFLLVWQIGDSILALGGLVAAVGISFSVIVWSEEHEEEIPWWARYPAIPLGTVVMLVFLWPLIMWTELLISRNNIDSGTDMIAVWLFVAQVVTLLLPSCTPLLGCFRSK